MRAGRFVRHPLGRRATDHRSGNAGVLSGACPSHQAAQRIDHARRCARGGRPRADAVLDPGLVVVPDEDSAPFERELETAGVPPDDPAQDEVRLRAGDRLDPREGREPARRVVTAPP